jgi:hypothetical protein
MKAVKYKIKIKGLESPDGTISIRALKELTDLLLECSERSLRLAVQGESIKRGKPPGWLLDSLDFTVTGLETGSTALAMDAPPLSETALLQIQQPDLWYSTPGPGDTALTLLSRAVKDTVHENLESNSYDAGVLEGLLSLESFLRNFGERIILESPARPTENFALGCQEIERIRQLKADTPESKAFVVSGEFDTIQHSNKRFQLRLSNGIVIPGTVDSEYLSAEDMRKFWGKKVTIKGIVHFRPGRKVRLIEAQIIKLAEEGEEVFERIPTPPKSIGLFESDVQRLNAGPALEGIWGKWPGDESIEELLAALTT